MDTPGIHPGSAGFDISVKLLLEGRERVLRVLDEGEKHTRELVMPVSHFPP
jgi:hypothetical protein